MFLYGQISLNDFSDSVSQVQQLNDMPQELIEITLQKVADECLGAIRLVCKKWKTTLEKMVVNTVPPMMRPSQISFQSCLKPFKEYRRMNLCSETFEEGMDASKKMVLTERLKEIPQGNFVIIYDPGTFNYLAGQETLKQLREPSILIRYRPKNSRKAFFSMECSTYDATLENKKLLMDGGYQQLTH